MLRVTVKRRCTLTLLDVTYVDSAHTKSEREILEVEIYTRVYFYVFNFRFRFIKGKEEDLSLLTVTD